MSREDGTISGPKKYFLEANGRQLALQEGDIIVGRSRNCNLVLKDPSASRNHALLIVHPDGVRLKDLNSTNGTYVNNQRLTEDLPLSPGDRISIGQTEMVFGATEDVLSSAAEVPAAVKPAAGLRQEETSDDKVPTALGPTAAATDLGAGTGLAATGLADTGVADLGAAGIEAASPGAANTGEGARVSRSATTSVLSRNSREAEAARRAHASEGGGDEAGSLGSATPGSTTPAAGEAGTTTGSDEAVDEISVLDALEEELQPSLPQPDAPAPPADDIPDSGETVPEDPAAAAAPHAVSGNGSGSGGSGELLPSLDLDDFDQDPVSTSGDDLPSSSAAGSAMAAEATASSATSSTGGYRADSVVFSSGRQRAAARGPMLEPAGFGIRLAAALVDFLLLGLLGAGVFFGAGGPQSTAASTLSSLATCAGALLMLLFGWTLWGTTPGKRLFKLYIRQDDGAELSAGKAILRLLGYLASTLALGLGFLMIAFTKGKRGLHDVIAGTYVGRA